MAVSLFTRVALNIENELRRAQARVPQERARAFEDAPRRGGPVNVVEQAYRDMGLDPVAIREAANRAAGRT